MGVRSVVVSALVIAGCAHAEETVSAAAARGASVCQTPAHRALDFWVGEWQVFVSGTETLAGLSTIAIEDGGCVVTEHYRIPGASYSGRSLNIFSAERGQWEQFWVDSTGDITHFIGQATPAGMQFTAEDDVGPGMSAPIFSRITFTRNEDGSVRQHGQKSSDRGATWSDRYDFTYRRAP